MTRTQKIESPRVIFNNDGGDSGLFSQATIESPEAFLETRTSPLAGTHVDLISYSNCHGLGFYKRQMDIENLPPGADAQDSDPLQLTVKFAHANGMKAFWSMRMNPTHDATPRRANVFAANRFKQENLDCLMGSPDQIDSFRQWSAADFDNPKVHELILNVVGEVLETVAVDGIELDFLRHPVFFRDAVNGIAVADAQVNKMSGLVQRIRALIDSAAKRCGRSLTLAVRAPDDVDYARAIGLDIEHWMRSGWIDLYIPSCYFRLHDWRHSVELGHRYGVKVYAGLSEPRVSGTKERRTRKFEGVWRLRHGPGDRAHELRASDECYRARAACAWAAGVDGVYIFNLFNPERSIWNEVGEPDVLDRLDKVYFASDLGAGKLPRGHYPFHAYQRIPDLCPDRPIQIESGSRTVVPIDLAEPNDAPDSANYTVTLKLQCSSPSTPQVVFNGNLVGSGSEPATIHSLPLRHPMLRRGSNTVEIVNPSGEPMTLEDLWVDVRHGAT